MGRKEIQIRKMTEFVITVKGMGTLKIRALNYMDTQSGSKFKRLRMEKGSSSRAQVNMINNPFDEDVVNEKRDNSDKLSPALSNLVQQEVNKILKGKQPALEQVNFAHISNFIGNIYSNFNYASDFSYECWVVDTGATSHVCFYKEKFLVLKPPSKRIVIHLPDGNVKLLNKY